MLKKNEVPNIGKCP